MIGHKTELGIIPAMFKKQSAIVTLIFDSVTKN